MNAQGKNFNYLVSKKNKAYICEPAFSGFLNAANKNILERLKWNFQICGISASGFKDMVRRDILNSAYSFCFEKGVGFEKKDIGSYVFATGHQSVFYHPGVWIKNFLIDSVSKNDNIVGLNIWVDYEEGCHEAFKTPCVADNKLKQKNIPLNVPFCNNVAFCLPAPTRNLWDNFSSHVKACLKTLPDVKPLANFENYLSCADEILKDTANLSEFIGLSRRRFEEASKKGKNYLELPVSAILKTDSFLLFFLDIINKIDGFNFIYNHILDEYRTKHSIRSDANPFPNLRLQGNFFELPFWAITKEGVRCGLWYDKDKNALCARREKIIKLDKNASKSAEILKNSEYRFVFKAVTLMMYFRMFASDFFLHGTGGAKYDAVTDEIIQKFYNAPAPSYAAATMNLYIDIPEIKYNEKEKFEIEKKLIQLKHNPQKLISQNTVDEKPRLKELIREKESLVRKIKNAPLDDKKIFADKIKNINASLEKEIKHVKAELEEKFKALNKKEEECGVASFREYPFCFYDPQDMERMAKEIIKTGHA